MDGVAWRSARLSVQVEALYKHRMVRHTPDPHVALRSVVQLNTFTDVKSGRSDKNNKINIKTLVNQNYFNQKPAETGK